MLHEFFTRSLWIHVDRKRVTLEQSGEKRQFLRELAKNGEIIPYSNTIQTNKKMNKYFEATISPRKRV